MALSDARAGEGIRASAAKWIALVALACVLGACTSPSDKPQSGLARIDHIVVIYAENRSFDNLYGLFPGANGIANATPAQYTQVDRDGKPLAELPPAWRGKEPDPAFPWRMPNKPFRFDAPPLNLPLTKQVRSPIHEFYRNREQITSGTLAYAAGAGKSVISTPYIYARELLDDGRGLLIPYRDALAITRAVLGVMADDEGRQAMRARVGRRDEAVVAPAVDLLLVPVELVNQVACRR